MARIYPDTGDKASTFNNVPSALTISAGELLAAARALQGTAKGAAEQQVMCAAENAVLPVVYGQRKIGGLLAGRVVSGNYLYLRVVWCHGEVDSIVETWMNGVPPGVSVSRNHYTGAAGQGVDPLLVEGYAANSITYTDTLPGVCYSAYKIPRSASDGFPEFIAEIKGQKVKPTSNGTPAWSDCPALCIADFRENTVYGMGLPVNWTDVATLKSANDALVGGEKRRTLNIALIDEQYVDDWLDVLCAHAGAWKSDEGGTLRLAPRYATGSPVITFDTSNIEEGSLELIKGGPRDQPTVVRCTYADISVHPTADGTVYAKASGVDAGSTDWRETPLPMPGINRYSQADREAVEFLNAVTLSDLKCSLRVFDVGLKLQIGDPVAITHPVGLSSKAFWITDIVATSAGRYTLTCTEYDAAITSDRVVSSPSTPDGVTTSAASPGNVTGLTLTDDVTTTLSNTYHSRIRASWTAPANFPFVSAYRVDVTLVSGGAVIDTRIVARPEYLSPPVTPGVAHVVTVYVISTVGVVSSGTASGSFTPAARPAIPGNVASLSADVSTPGIASLTWPAVTGAASYDLRYDGANWAAATQIDRIAAPGLRYDVSKIPAGSHTYRIKARDAVRDATYPYGQESATEATATATITPVTMGTLTNTEGFIATTPTSLPAAPNNPSSLAAHVVAGQIHLYWTGGSGFVLGDYEIRYGNTSVTWDAATTLARVPALTTNFDVDYPMINATGTFKFLVRAYDMVRNGTYPQGQPSASSTSINAYMEPITTGSISNIAGFVNASGAAAAAPVQSVNTNTGAITINTGNITNSAGFVNAAGAASAAPVQSVNGDTGNLTVYTRDCNNDAGFIATTPASPPTAPNSPTGASAYTHPGAVNLVWTAASGFALGDYEIRYGGTSSTWDGATGILGRVEAGATKFPVTYAMLNAAGTFRFLIRAYDMTRNVTYPNGQPSASWTYINATMNAIDTGTIGNAAGYVNTTQAAAAAPVQSVNTNTGAITINTGNITNSAGFVNASGAASAAPVQSVNGDTGNLTVYTRDCNNDAGFIATTPGSLPTAPANPSSAFAYTYPGQVSIYWTGGSGFALGSYEIRYGGTSATWDTATGTLGRVDAGVTKFDIPYAMLNAAGTFRFLVRAYDMVRNATYPNGQPSSSYTYVNAAMAAVDTSTISNPAGYVNTAQASAAAPVQVSNPSLTLSLQNLYGTGYLSLKNNSTSETFYIQALSGLLRFDSSVSGSFAYCGVSSWSIPPITSQGATIWKGTPGPRLTFQDGSYNTRGHVGASYSTNGIIFRNAADSTTTFTVDDSGNATVPLTLTAKAAVLSNTGGSATDDLKIDGGSNGPNIKFVHNGTTRGFLRGKTTANALEMLNVAYNQATFTFNDNGDLYCYGQCSATTCVSRSDAALKDKIRPLESGSLGKIRALQARKYERKDAPGIDEVGFVAQEIAEAMPDAVGTEHEYFAHPDTGEVLVDRHVATYSLNAVLAHAVEAIKALADRIDKLEQRK